jgi:hypothetical protein
LIAFHFHALMIHFMRLDSSESIALVAVGLKRSQCHVQLFCWLKVPADYFDPTTTAGWWLYLTHD